MVETKRPEWIVRRRQRRQGWKRRRRPRVPLRKEFLRAGVRALPLAPALQLRR